MASTNDLLRDPVLAVARAVGGYRVLPPCVLFARLGRGGMGAVYLGKHMGLLALKAVKVLLLQDSDVARFRREAQIGDALSHENLVRVSTLEAYRGLHYLVMDYVDGEDLTARVDRRGPMTEVEALTTLLFAARGLGYAHAAGIVHRDVKPANIMLSTRGDVKVSDLGLARARDVAQSMTLGPMGTPPFMAPEQWETSKVGPEADVWALGATLYYLLVGRSHLPGGLENGEIRRLARGGCLPDIRSTRADVSAATSALIQRCTAVDPAARFPNANALAEELARMARADRALLADAAATAATIRSAPTDDEVVAIQRDFAADPDGSGDDDRGGASGRGRGRERDGGGSGAAVATRTRATMVSPVQPARRRRWRWPLLGFAAAGAAAVAFVLLTQRVDADELVRQAGIARQAARYADAVQLLTRVESVPGRDLDAREQLNACYQAWVEGTERDDPIQAFALVSDWRRMTDRMTPVEGGELRRKDVDGRLQRVRAAAERRIRDRCTLTAPKDGAWRTSPRVTVRGAVALPDVRVLLVDTFGERELLNTAGAFEGDCTVPEAGGDVRVVFRHANGLEADAVVRVNVQPPLAPRLSAPAATRDPEVRLEGSVQSAPVALRIEWRAPGQAADAAPRSVDVQTADGELTFARGIALPPDEDGEYAFVLVATGKADEPERSAPVRVRVDRAGPQLQLEPLPARTVARSVRVRGTSDEAGTVCVDGEPEARATLAAGAPFELEVPLGVPADCVDDQDVQRTLVADDVLGNRRRKTVSIVYDGKPPVVAIDAPAADAQVTRGAAVTVRGTVNEDDCRVGIGDALAPCVERRFEFAWTPTPLPADPSRAELVVRVVDAVGREGEAVRRRVSFAAIATPPAASEVAKPVVPEPEPARVPAWAEAIGDARLDRLPLRVRVRANPDLELRLVDTVVDGKPRRFYLGVTEVPGRAWRAFLQGAAPEPKGFVRYTLSSATGTWAANDAASWNDPMPELWPGGASAPELPVTQVNASVARAFCAAYGLRLPHVDEWRAACTPPGCEFGWIPARSGRRLLTDDVANAADKALLEKLQATEFRRLGQYDRSLEDGFPYLAPVGTFPRANDVHPLGFADLFGNVAEWCWDARSRRYFALGGSWAQSGKSSLEAEGDFAAESGYDAVGFRVAADVPD